MTYQPVPKHNITLKIFTEQKAVLQEMLIQLELCRESDDILWKELMLNHLDTRNIFSQYDSQVKEQIRKELHYNAGY